jgi:uncharacterized protein
MPNLAWSSLFLTLGGMSLGMLGAGGSAIVVPVLVYLAGMNAHQAVVVSLALVGAASLVGVALNARKGAVVWRTALAMMPSGVVGAWLGARWSSLLSARAMLLTFSGLLLIVAIKILLEHPDETRERRPPSLPAEILAGFGIGIITGLLGIGGGFVIVPVLIYFGGLPMRSAIATSLVVACVNSSVALAGHMAHGEGLGTGLPLMLACAIVGMAAGIAICHRTQPAKLKRGFAVLLIGMAVFLVVKNL